MFHLKQFHMPQVALGKDCIGVYKAPSSLDNPSKIISMTHKDVHTYFHLDLRKEAFLKTQTTSS